ncbi:MAG: hypothetical protein OEU26_24860 [Candidatus Tectomicrobia bacterium]|nr:hypothetical protein [Candidatus Tectomicrobia bacterium]
MESQDVHDTLGNDYTGIAMLVGSLMIGIACVFMWLAVDFAFSITALVWGSIIVCAALFFRHKTTEKYVRYIQGDSRNDKQEC